MHPINCAKQKTEAALEAELKKRKLEKEEEREQ